MDDLKKMVISRSALFSFSCSLLWGFLPREEVEIAHVCYRFEVVRNRRYTQRGWWKRGKERHNLEGLRQIPHF